jgi:IclR family acetate operon transcriptional repressor
MSSVLTALRVLEEVATQQPVGVSDLTLRLQLPKSTVQRALGSLHAAGWLRPAGSEPRRWLVTSRALHVGLRAAGELGLRDAAIPVMEELLRRTDETIHLMVPEGTKMVLIERLETPKPVRIVIPLGGSAPIHASSNGKAFLASSRREDVERLLPPTLPGYTETTTLNRSDLLSELEKVRLRGDAINSAEWRDDICAVAAPILCPEGAPIASISISTPINRMPEELQPTYGALVQRAAQNISQALGRPLSATLTRDAHIS